MSEFKNYRRSQIAEIREVTQEDLEQYASKDYISVFGWQHVVSISSVDKEAGSPKIGDMIARNPKNHNDQWLIAEQYFKDNFEETTSLTNKQQYQQKVASIDFADWLMQNCELIQDAKTGKNILWRFEGDDYTLEKLYNIHKVL